MRTHPPLLALLVLSTGCGSAVRVELKPQTIEKTFETNSAPGGSCPAGGGLFGTMAVSVRDLSQSAGVDLSQVCLARGAHFSVEAGLLEAEPSKAPNDACTAGGLKGQVTLTGFDVSYVWVDQGTSRTELFTLPCAGTTIDLTQGIDLLSEKVNACLAQTGAEGDEFLRQGINRNPETFTVTGAGTCSADACYYLKYSLRVRLLSGAATGRPCD